MRNVRHSLLAIAIAAALLPSSLLRGAELRARVARLLDLRTENNQAAVAAARELYAQLKRAAPNDPRIDYAYGMVLMDQGRPREALPLISIYVDGEQDDLVPAVIKALSLMENRRYAEGLTEAVAVADRFPKSDGKSEDDEPAEVARLLGTLIGLHSVRSTAAETKARVQATNQILNRLGDAYIVRFDEGRRHIIDHFNELRQTRQSKLDHQFQAKADQQNQLAAAADRSRIDVATTQQDLDAGGEAVKNAQRELTLLDQQMSLLAQDRHRLGMQITTLECQIVSIVAPVSTTETRNFAFGTNPVLESVTQSTTRSVNAGRYFQAQGLAMSLAVLKKQAFDMDKRILSLRARAAQVAGEGHERLKSLATSEAGLRQAHKRTASLETQARRAKAKPSTPPRLLTAEMQRLSTYLPSLYEEESKRVLLWFDK